MARDDLSVDPEPNVALELTGEEGKTGEEAGIDECPEVSWNVSYPASRTGLNLSIAHSGRIWMVRRCLFSSHKACLLIRSPFVLRVVVACIAAVNATTWGLNTT